MFDQMNERKSFSGLLLILLVAIGIGTLISGIAISASPIGAFALIFGVSALIVLAIELAAYFRKRPHDKRPMFWRPKRRRRQAARSHKKSEPLLESDAELVESYTRNWIQ
jgi:hypothetical protein